MDHRANMDHLENDCFLPWTECIHLIQFVYKILILCAMKLGSGTQEKWLGHREVPHGWT